MNLSKLRSLTLLALAAGAAFMTPAAQAVPAAAADGDLILGVRASSGTGATTDYVIDLGSASTLTANSSAVTVKTIGSDLNGTFGGGTNAWSSSSTVFWGVAGTTGLASVGSDAAKTVWATRARTTSAVATPWLRGSAATQSGPESKIEVMMSAYDSSTVAGSAANSVLQTIATTTNNWASYQPGGTVDNSGPTSFSFAAYSPSIEGNPGDTLDLFKMQPGSGNGVFQGSFTLSNSGVVTFTPASAEASTVSIGSTYSVGESAGSVTVTLTRTPTAGPASVLVSTSNGTALAGTDYTAVTALEVDFAAGQATQTASIPVIDRLGVAGSRDFTVTISANDALTSIGTASSDVTITSTPTGAADFTAAEFDEVAGASTVTVNLTRSGSTVAPLTVALTSGNAAVTSGTATFLAGSASASAVLTVTPNSGFSGHAVTVTITTHAGSTQPATTVFLPGLDSRAPALTVTAPIATVPTVTGTTAVGNVLISATTSDDIGVGSVQVKINGGAFQDITSHGSTVSGVTTFAAVPVSGLDVINGYNTVTIRATDSNHNITDVVRTVKYVVNGTPTVAIAGPFTTAPATSSVLVAGIPTGTTVWAVGAIKALTAKPFATPGGTVSAAVPAATDLAFSYWEVGGVTVSTSLIYTFTFTSDLLTAPITAHYIANPFNASVAGRYDGLITPRSGFASSNATYGAISATVTTKGAFTGSLYLDGVKTALTGSMNNAGNALFGTTVLVPYKTITIGSSVFTLIFTVDPGSHTLTGVVYDGTNLSDISAPHSTTSVAPGSAKVFNFFLPPPAVSSTFPQGDSVGSVTISALGAVTGSLTLADGLSKVTFSTVAATGTGSTYTFPLFAGLYGTSATSPTTGSISGLVTVDTSAANTDISATSLHWFRPAGGTGIYPDGWPAGTTLALNGLIYTAGAPVIPGLGAITPTIGNAKVTINNGVLSSPFSKNVNISPTTTPGTVTLVSPATTANTPIKLTLSLGGIFTGQINTATLGLAAAGYTYNGIILTATKGTTVSGGYGYFLSGNTSSAQSGLTTLIHN